MNPATPLRGLADIERLLEAHADLHALLSHVESLGLPDGWIGAGFIRNTVWDVLHGRAVDMSCLNDVDVVFLDPTDVSKERDASLEAQLRILVPDMTWQVRNQARMHHANGDAPYRNTCDAIACWPETATAIAARSVGGKVEIMAPHGIQDLLNLIVRPTPAFEHKMGVYRKRVASKNWPARWPKLTMLMTWDEAYPALQSSFDRIET
ncbi:nucleotidyltransferase family protein [Microvirga mediterraneensis]|uniref:Nucleotidyltransferase family protein n=1 Tax=Microvirga mediterraneensis TaxID=2754695 RepID=A0A838BK23_9HYPH|nr:nucleotidyltransferase family protein [Microvirga mediterraneensis]MBA1155820.1 nucleotidyltransferase family protein [Microvirga mediterraneensis]